jgi:hypothetical protein
MAGTDWRSDHWLRVEQGQIIHVAHLAGRYAYQGAGWSRHAIHQEAYQYLRRSMLFAPHQRDARIIPLVIGGFLQGWQERENEEGQP